MQVYADEAAKPEWKIQTHDDLIKYRGECVAALSITEEAVSQYKKWVFNDDEKTRSYIKCVFNKMGLFEDQSGFNIEHLVKQLGQNRDAVETRTEVVKCSDKKVATDDAATWAFKGFKCFRAAHLDLIQMSIKKAD